MTVPTSHLGIAAVISGNHSELGSHRQANARQPHFVCRQENGTVSMEWAGDGGRDAKIKLYEIKHPTRRHGTNTM